MSKDNVKKFFEELEKNPVLKEKFLNTVKENHEKARRQMTVKMVDFAKASGFSFGENDILELQSDLMDQANNIGELNDADLMKAAGGFQSSQLCASIMTFGLYCAIQSIATEAMRKGGCKAHFDQQDRA